MKKWDELTPTEQDTVDLILISLQEFCYGFHRLQEGMLQGLDPLSAINRFYTNVLYMYTANYFVIRGDNKLAGAITKLELGELLDDIYSILNTPLGSTTLRKILDHYRDKFLTHNRFGLDVLAPIYRDFDLSDPDNERIFIQTAFRLFQAIEDLAVDLASLYPENIIAASFVSEPKEN